MSTHWAVMCGLVRDEAQARAKIETFSRWRRNGLIDGVAVCWWARETERWPELVARLRDEGFLLIEVQEPRLKVVGHFIHQSMTHWYALQATPDEAMVLKTRPDLGTLDSDVERRLLAPGIPPSPPRGWPDLFRDRIVAASVFPTSPFYINDILYHGRREDLLRLARFDLAPEYTCNWLEAEHFTHTPPARSLFPLLDAYLQIHPPFWHGEPDRARIMMNTQLASDTYLDVLATHLRVLNSYYRIGWRTPDLGSATEAAFSTRAIGEIFGGPTGLPGCTFAAGPGVVSFDSHEPVHALLNGWFAHDALGDRFRAALERTSNYGYVVSFGSNPFRPHPAIDQLAAELQAVRFAEHKLRFQPPPGPGRTWIRGAPERVWLIDADAESQKMQDELHALRRAVAALQANATRDPASGKDG